MDIFEMHNEFMLKADPDMPPFTHARHVERYLSKVVFRMGELDKKADAFLEKHKDANFMKDLSN